MKRQGLPAGCSTSFTKLKLFLHKIPFIINTLFPPLSEKLYAATLNLFAERSELFIHAEVKIVVFRKTASSDHIFLSSKNIEVRWC